MYLTRSFGMTYGSPKMDLGCSKDLVRIIKVNIDKGN